MHYVDAMRPQTSEVQNQPTCPTQTRLRDKRINIWTNTYDVLKVLPVNHS